MSLLSKIFKKKAGGTLIGNLFRSVTGGITGPAPTQYDIDLKELNDADFAKKYGTDKRGVPIDGVTPTPQQQQNLNAAGSPTPAGAKQSFWQKKWVKVTGIAIGSLLLITLIVWGVRKAKKGGKRRY
ncbi:MAG: hypothetical protein J0H92_07880 [Sphingobacteriales bacterium]|nr:hypothetical protein [Sphingobacteriales bacterium]OJW30087.1 MAG: hypothetical protein BGO54_00380 [Sphingobacteriales bacterium 46-32]